MKLREARASMSQPAVACEPGREVLVGAGSKDGDQVFIKADKLGRTRMRYFTKAWSGPVAVTSTFGAEIMSSEQTGKTLDIKGKVWSPIGGSSLSLRPRDVSRFRRHGDALVRKWASGATHTLTDVWKSLNGKGVKASRMKFNATVAADSPTLLDVGRYLNGYGEPTRLKLHLDGGNITGVSMVIETHKLAKTAE